MCLHMMVLHSQPVCLGLADLSLGARFASSASTTIRQAPPESLRAGGWVDHIAPSNNFNIYPSNNFNISPSNHFISSVLMLRPAADSTTPPPLFAPTYPSVPL